MEQQPVTLFIGSDAESDEAKRVLKDAGIELYIVDGMLGERDFQLPLLLTAWGVFEDLQSIIWFTEVAKQRQLEGRPEAAGMRDH